MRRLPPVSSGRRQQAPVSPVASLAPSGRGRPGHGGGKQRAVGGAAEPGAGGSRTAAAAERRQRRREADRDGRPSEDADAARDETRESRWREVAAMYAVDENTEEVEEERRPPRTAAAPPIAGGSAGGAPAAPAKGGRERP